MKSKKEATARQRVAGLSNEDKFRILLESCKLADRELGEFLRREGLFEAELERFREEVGQVLRSSDKPRGRCKVDGSAWEARALRKELKRKEKALAETAALLVLRGKVEAFLAGEGEGATAKKKGK